MADNLVDPRDKARALERAQGDKHYERMLLEDGQPVSISGSNGRFYLLQKKEGFYSCTCPLWRHQAVDGVQKEMRRCVLANCKYTLLLYVYASHNINYLRHDL